MSEDTNLSEVNIDELSYEAAVEQIETLLSNLEQNDVPLEQAIKQFEQGTKLIRHCEKILAQTEQKIVGLTGEASPEASLHQETSRQETLTQGIKSTDLDDDIPF